jgi:hypothetical protein
VADAPNVVVAVVVAATVVDANAYDVATAPVVVDVATT